MTSKFSAQKNFASGRSVEWCFLFPYILSVFQLFCSTVSCWCVLYLVCAILCVCTLLKRQTKPNVANLNKALSSLRWPPCCPCKNMASSEHKGRLPSLFSSNGNLITFSIWSSYVFFLLFCRGRCGVVRKCIAKSTGQEYAAKFLKKRRRGQDCKAEILHEIAVLELMKSNPRIVNLHEVYETANEIILVLE